MFYIYLRTNSDLCHLQHKLIGFYNRDEKCLQRGTDWVFKYGGLRFVCKGLNIKCVLHLDFNNQTNKCIISTKVPSHSVFYLNSDIYSRTQLNDIGLYRVIHKSLRDFRTRLCNNQDRHGRKEHINRYRISPSFFLY